MKSIIKEILVFLLTLGSTRLSGVAILMYHSISDSTAFFSTPRDAFERQMRYVHSKSFETIFASDILRRVEHERLANCVCITFDDGYEDIYTNAFPILKRYSLKATVFLITSQIGGEYRGSDDIALPLLSAAHIKEMRESGLIEFMPHGHTHRKLHQLSPLDQEAEIRQSTEAVQALTGKQPTVFAYPRGRSTPALAAILARFGYTHALGVNPGLVRNASERYNLPRNAVDKHVGFREFRLKLSDVLPWYLMLANKSRV